MSIDLSKLTPTDDVFLSNPVSEEQVPVWFMPEDERFWRLSRAAFDALRVKHGIPR